MKTNDSGSAQAASYRVYDSRSLGAAIRHFRNKAGLNQAELAEKSGIHRTYLSSLEQGHETEQIVRLLRVLRQLGVRISLEKADW